MAVAIASWVRDPLRLTFATFALLWTGAASAQECPAGTEPKPDGGCAPKVSIECPAGTIFEEGKGCVAKVVECPAGMVVEANKCVKKRDPAKPPPDAVGEPTKPPEAAKPPEPEPPPGPPKKLQLGLRIGLAVPLMTAYRSPIDESRVALSSELAVALPIGLEVGYRVLDALYLGGIVSFGPAFPRKASDGYCQPTATSCGGDHFRVALQGRFYPLRGKSFDPWLGLAVGYEWLTLREEGPSAQGGNGSVATTYSGLEFFELSAGGDLEILRDVRVGPFASFGLGQYSRASVREELGSSSFSSSDSIKNPALHGFLQLGARGAFGLL